MALDGTVQADVLSGSQRFVSKYTRAQKCISFDEQRAWEKDPAAFFVDHSICGAESIIG